MCGWELIERLLSELMLDEGKLLFSVRLVFAQDWFDRTCRLVQAESDFVRSIFMRMLPLVLIAVFF